MRVIGVYLLIIGLTLPLVSSISSPEIYDQNSRKGPPSNGPPIYNSINSNPQDPPFKPLISSYQFTNSIHPSSLSSNPNIKTSNSPSISHHSPLTSLQVGYQSASNPSYSPSAGPSLTSGGQPIVMQYLPQTQLTGGVQYLQFIPSRQLIFPYSPYITPYSSPPQGGNNYISSNPYHGSSTVPDNSGKTVQGSGHNDPIPSSSHSSQQSSVTLANSANLPGPHSIVSNSLSTSPFSLYAPGGSLVSGYASNTPTFKYIRPNSALEFPASPQELGLNLNEYMPPSNDQPPPSYNRVIRGRP